MPAIIVAAMRFLIALALVSGCTGGWSKYDTLREIGFAAEQSTDWYQTSWIVKNCDETNPIMGTCGGRMSPNVYFPVATALHAAVSSVLPPEWRRSWQYFTGGAEGTIVWMNFANQYEKR